MTNPLLSLVQEDFPLCQYPFLAIANKINSDEKSVIEALQELKNEKVIRQISAIFDTKKLGYKSSLVAFEMDEKDIDEAVKIVNSHPGVSHNYERNHKFNIWFTIAVAPNSSIGLEKTVAILASKTKAKNYIILPTLKMFKIAVKLDVLGTNELKQDVKKKELVSIDLRDNHFDIIKLLQKDIALVSEPFLHIVQALNITYDELFETVALLQNAGVLRRFAGILNHRKAGFDANAMVVWDIDENVAVGVGEELAKFSAVSHCYLRPKYPNWQYNIFTMIHAKSTNDAEMLIEQIANETPHKSKMILYSTREFKKVRIVYFSDEFSKWECDNEIS